MLKKSTLPLFIGFTLVVILACNLPVTTPNLPKSEISTAQAAASSLQPSLAVLPQTAITQASPGLGMAATVLSSNNSSPLSLLTPAGSPSSPEFTAVHLKTPADSGKKLVTITDLDSKPFASQKRTNGDAFDVNLLERPFTSEMEYRGDVDLLKAELSTDKDYYYFSLLLSDLSNSAVNENMYGIELDTDFDGRGEYLVWVGAPKSTDWKAENVAVYSDNDGDVGGNSPLKSDQAKSNGYEKVITSSKLLKDPDAVWVKVSPNNPNQIWIAVKPEIIGKPASFMWGAWADGGVKNPGSFDLVDTITLIDAGSPIKDDKNYPLKKLNTIDNTCRAGYGRTLTGMEPGLCSDMVTKPAKTIMDTIPQITLPAKFP